MHRHRVVLPVRGCDVRTSGNPKNLYRGMVAENNGWSHKAGALDINEVESCQQQYERHLIECQ